MRSSIEARYFLQDFRAAITEDNFLTAINNGELVTVVFNNFEKKPLFSPRIETLERSLDHGLRT